VSLKRDLGPQDQVKVDEYADAVRDVERRIEKAEQQSNLRAADPGAASGRTGCL